MAPMTTVPTTQVVSLYIEAELEAASRQLRSGLVTVNNTSSVTATSTNNDGSGGGGSGAAARGFVESFRAEQDRIGNALAAVEREIESSVRALLLRADALSRRLSSSPSKAAAASSPSASTTKTPTTVSASHVTDLKVQARALSDRALMLNAQTRVDADELRRVACLSDLVLGAECVDVGLSAMVERDFAEVKPWNAMDHCGGIMVVLLSDVHTIIRDLEMRLLKSRDEEEVAGDEKWVAPASFERITTKYWVAEEHLYQVLLASVTGLPLLVYGRKGGRILGQRELHRPNITNLSDASSSSDTTMIAGSSLWTSSLSGTITSVYFDSPDLDMYSERIKRNEGAQLLRIRWYGPHRPTGDDENVFLELKTHHECWVGNKSAKERVAIREGDVSRLLDLNGGRWDEELASSIIQRANPKEDKESIISLSKLLLKIRATVCKFKLTACVRTRYTRVALQSSSNNRCRLTIDKDVTVINERSRSSKNSWCLADSDAIPRDAIVKLPYAVYEVKVAGDDLGPPDFITELETSRAIVEAKKFSKFLSGASVFNADRVKTLPWWVTDSAFVPLFREGAMAGSPTDAHDSNISSNADAVANDWPNNEAPETNFDATMTTRSIDSNEFKPLTSSSLETIVEEAQPVQSKRFRRSLALQSSIRRRINGRSSLPRGIPFSLNKKNNNKSLMINKPNVADKTRLRVEPKSYFANERTFIQWISAALLFITFSQMLYILAGSNENMKDAGIAGTWMLAMSLFITLYGLATYYRRVYLMTNGKPYGYADIIGPGILSFSIITGVVLIMVFTHQSRRSLTSTPAAGEAAVSTMSHQEGMCIRRPLEGIPGESRISLVLELQPSGIVIDEAQGRMLVPSMNKIIAMRDGLPTDQANGEPVQVVATLKAMDDIEALENNGDQVFALSETKGGAQVIALEWDDDGMHLHEVIRWKVSMPAPEGMALVPGQHGTSSELLIAQEAIDVFNLDSFKADIFDREVEREATIDSRLLSKGLNDGKAGDMQFFEGLLWVLFDNSRVIRAFELETGAMMHEISLPVAERGSKKQWEGMRLQRILESGEAVTRRLRGVRTSRKQEASQLVLHLALDTPAQVWSLRLEEEGGRLVLPSCATGMN